MSLRWPGKLGVPGMDLVTSASNFMSFFLGTDKEQVTTEGLIAAVPEVNPPGTGK